MEAVWAVAIAVRAVVGLWEYSGAGQPPMFGDFEAQRHWMEVTTSLPLGDWYRNTTQNDLLYWGLDYPPLTAYVSYAFGRVGALLVPELVELRESRGHESVEGKVFMRCTVLLCDAVLFIPVMRWVCGLLRESRAKEKGKGGGTERGKGSQYVYVLSCLLLPGLLLIDHGHFQYNGVCLALSLLGLSLVSRDWDILGSVCFCLSLNFKQMSLYYAPVFFCHLLRKCLTRRTVLSRLLAVVWLGITVVAVFILLWAPFCLYASDSDSCGDALLQVLHRQFPFSRGIFEDKVANIWYSLSVLVDLRALPQPQLLLSSLGLTLALLAPPCWHLLTHDASFQGLLLALVNSSLAFFLASFQVHEKSVLLVLAPAAPLVLLDPLFFGWVQLLGCFTMFPLLRKDGLVIPYLACCVLYACLLQLQDSRGDGLSLGNGGFIRNQVSEKSAVAQGWGVNCSGVLLHPWLRVALVLLSCLGMAVLHTGEAFLPPPRHLPHLYPALFSIFGALNLIAIYARCVCLQWASPLRSPAGEKLKTS